MDQNKVFHGCFDKNRGSTNRVIAPGEKCITPTSEPIWRYPEDIFARVRTRSQEQKYQQQKKLTKTEFQKYFKEKLIEKWLNSSENLSTELEYQIIDEHFHVCSASRFFDI